MIAVVDVHYRPKGAVAACVLADDWTATRPAAEFVEHIPEVSCYVPGQFYKRELPCLLAVLAKAGDVDAVVIDGYVWLGPKRPGLGAHLHDALHQMSAVVGVAKTRFLAAAGVDVPVLRARARPRCG